MASKSKDAELIEVLNAAFRGTSDYILVYLREKISGASLGDEELQIIIAWIMAAIGRGHQALYASLRINLLSMAMRIGALFPELLETVMLQVIPAVCQGFAGVEIGTLEGRTFVALAKMMRKARLPAEAAKSFCAFLEQLAKLNPLHAGDLASCAKLLLTEDGGKAEGLLRGIEVVEDLLAGVYSKDSKDRRALRRQAALKMSTDSLPAFLLYTAPSLPVLLMRRLPDSSLSRILQLTRFIQWDDPLGITLTRFILYGAFSFLSESAISVLLDPIIAVSGFDSLVRLGAVLPFSGMPEVVAERIMAGLLDPAVLSLEYLVAHQSEMSLAVVDINCWCIGNILSEAQRSCSWEPVLPRLYELMGKFGEMGMSSRPSVFELLRTTLRVSTEYSTSLAASIQQHHWQLEELQRGLLFQAFGGSLVPSRHKDRFMSTLETLSPTFPPQPSWMRVMHLECMYRFTLTGSNLDAFERRKLAEWHSSLQDYFKGILPDCPMRDEGEFWQRRLEAVIKSGQRDRRCQLKLDKLRNIHATSSSTSSHWMTEELDKLIYKCMLQKRNKT